MEEPPNVAAAAPQQRAMFAGHSRHLVTSSVRRRQEAELVEAEERERVAAEIAAAAARASRLVAAELAAARVEVEAEAVVAAARAAAEEADSLRSNASSSVCADDSADTDLELLAKVAAQDRVAQWAASHAHGGGALAGGMPGGGALDGGALGGGAPGGGAPGGGGGGAPDDRALEAQRLRERVAQLEAEMAHDRRQGRHDGERATGGVAPSPLTGTKVTTGSRLSSGTAVGLPSPRRTTSSGPQS
jgi:hypothetical protein